MRVSRPAGDTGEADPRVTGALGAYADGTGSEHAALTAVAAARLLVPVVAVLAEVGEQGADPSHAGGHRGRGVIGGRGAPQCGGETPRGRAEQAEMALPTLIGNDGRRAIIAFTGTQALRRWKQDARPVPVPAPRVWAAAVAEADAVVIDVAGPVPMVVEGARLRALANGEPPPLPHVDPDVRAEVAAVTPGFTLGPGSPGADLRVTLKTADMDQARQIALRLSARFRRGIEIKALLSRTEAADSRPPLALS